MSSPHSAKIKSSKKRPTTPNADAPSNGDIASQVPDAVKSAVTSEWDYKVALAIITLLAFVTRFWGIRHPDQVVFDEVHFGKFASHYLQRAYFFDVHPPFGKLLFALAGWFVGYRGEFLFENIGDSYITNRVPYVAYRTMPALLGSLTVTTVFCIMWESGYSLPACVLATGLILFDNGHVGQTRLILLDATLVFAMALSVLCYVRFYKLRHVPFGRKWWKWLLLTGLSLSCVISTKYVGAFTFFSIGVPVMIDLWDLMDVKRKRGALTMPEFGKHLGARALGLIVFPFFVYLFWFQVHFAILSRSGPGDDFMSPEFQETLSDNIMTAQSVGINYFDAMTIRHKETKVYLHSHVERYPLRYEDGRVSSQGQQVTGYAHNDTNNVWQIVPTRNLTGETPVLNGEIVQLRHLGTNTWLLSHDVASPYYPTNQEFTTVPSDDAKGTRFNDTLFEIKIDNGREGQEFRTKASYFKLVHLPSKVCMWTHTTPLPEWAYNQAEINGNKNMMQSSNNWFVEDLPQIPADSPRRERVERKPRSIPFLKKWVELQRLMFYHNNQLTSSHPYASDPISWPFLLRGVSFWTNNDTRAQIYYLGNPLGWWLVGSLLAVFAGLILADQLSLRRGVDSLDERTRSRLYNSTGFFFLIWAAHYLPFFIMGRQLFLHHYLPAHLASVLVAGALLEFILNIEPLDARTSYADALNPQSHATFTMDGSSQAKKKSGATQSAAGTRVPIRQRLGAQNLWLSWAVTVAILSVVAWGFFFFAPLTYGAPPLNVEETQRRQWLGYDLHFAK